MSQFLPENSMSMLETCLQEILTTEKMLNGERQEKCIWLLVCIVEKMLARTAHPVLQFFHCSPLAESEFCFLPWSKQCMTTPVTGAFQSSILVWTHQHCVSSVISTRRSGCKYHGATMKTIGTFFVLLTKGKSFQHQC